MKFDLRKYFLSLSIAPSFSMVSDSADETPTLTMDDRKFQFPRTLLSASSSPIPASLLPLPLDLSKLPPSPAPWGEVVEYPDFYHHNVYDNSFPFHNGILSNERRFSNSPPTPNMSFPSEPTSFNAQPLLKSNQDSGLSSDNFGLPPNNWSPSRGNDNNGQDFPRNIPWGGGSFIPSPHRDFLGGEPGTPILPHDNFNYIHGNGSNDSGISSMGTGSHLWDYSPAASVSTPQRNVNHFDFSFPIPDNSFMRGDELPRRGSNGNGSSNSSDASAGSPTRGLSQGNQDNFHPNQWTAGDVSSLLDNLISESSCSNSEIATPGLGNTIWSPNQVPAPNNLGGDNNAQNGGCNAAGGVDVGQWDMTLARLTKQQLLGFDKLLMKTHQECIQNGDIGSAERIQALLVHVQHFIIKAFVPQLESCEGRGRNVSPPMLAERSPPPLLPFPPEPSLDRIAELHKNNAGNRDTQYTWSGQLPPRIHRFPVVYSCKVFLGGLPFDITEQTLFQALKPFGIIKIEWPGKEVNGGKIKGFAYAILESEKHVKLLLQNCLQDFDGPTSGNYYYQVSSKRYRNKNVQVIPWAMSDSNYVRCQASKIDPLKTIFVGALHGMVNAEGLATIMNDLFGGVVYAGIDTDKQKYPIGSARVTFNNERSYMKAVTACYVYIKTGRFEKKVQVDPYLEDATCSICKLQQGPYFCRNKSCFNYYCRTCFHLKHAEGNYRNHRPMMRTASSRVGFPSSANANNFSKICNNSGVDQTQFRPGNQQLQRQHPNNGMLMKEINGQHQHHHHSNNGNGLNNLSGGNTAEGNNAPNTNNHNPHRNVWHNSNYQRFQPWNNRGAGAGNSHDSRQNSSPPSLMNNHLNHINATQHGPQLPTMNCCANNGNKLNNLTGEPLFSTVAASNPNQGTNDLGGGGGGSHAQNQMNQHGFQQQFNQQSFNNQRKFPTGGLRQQQQQAMRIQ